MSPMKRYIAEEIAFDHAEGLMTRREALRRLALLGLGTAAATTLLAACSKSDPVVQGTPPAGSASGTPSPGPTLSTEAITFTGPRGTLMGAWAAATSPRGGVLVIHENRGLTDHIKSVAGRFAGSGYSALAIDLLSEEGGTASFSDSAQATAALGNASDDRFVADMKAGVTELAKRVGGKKVGTIGFCFGGGMVWLLIDSDETRLAAAAPFYGPSPEAPDFAGSKAAVLGVYAEQDDRVNATRDRAKQALEKANLTHELVTYPGVGHAFFNDTGMRYNADAAAQAYLKVLSWFGTHIG